MKIILKDFLVSFRNYCFNETKNSKDETYAESAHLQMFMMIIFVYLSSIPVSLLLIALKVLPGALTFVKASPIFKLIYAVLVLFYLGKQVLKITRHIAAVPADRNWGNKKLRQLRPIYITFMLLSLVTFFGVLIFTSAMLSAMGF